MVSRKRRRFAQKKGKPGTPLLPPTVGEDEVDVSDEDLNFVSKHFQYTGFLSSLDASSITKEVLGIKSSKKGDDDLELYYEKRAKLLPKTQEDASKLLDAATVLPVKTLSGELHFPNTKSKPPQKEEEGMLSFEERKALVRRKIPASASQSDSLPTDFVKLAKKEGKISKSELLKEQKKARKGKHGISKAQIDTADVSSQISALGELKQDLSEHERLEEIKTRVAELGTSVLADPEKHLDSLTDLQGFCSDRDANISCMAMLSLLAVYKDIVPGYRIRLPTPKELEMQVSKEVKKLRDFETKLLKCYQRYVQFLVKSIKSSPLRKVATRCATGLLEAIPHFNFCDSLLSVTIHSMDSKDRDCRKVSCDAIKYLFLNEGKHGGSATVEAVEMIADLVKTKECLLKPDVIEVLLSLSFKEDLRKPDSDQGNKKRYEAGAKKLNSMSEGLDKTAKKRQLAAKLREEVSADFRESSAMPEASELQRMQTQTLTALFETYFRILKASLDPVDRLTISNSASIKENFAEFGPRPLLPFCLDGLAKFSHLVSVEFMADLLALLKKLAGGNVLSSGVQVEDMNPMSSTDRLHCCIVAFKIVRSNLDALNIDLRDFYVSFYNLLPFHKLTSNEQDGLVLAEALHVMLWESRQHDMQRVAAFVKQLAAYCLYFGPAEAISALVTVRQLLQRYKKCRSLLDNDGDCVYRNLQSLQGEAWADPDLRNALSSILWELTVLSKHYHPAVSRLAEQISNMLASSEAASQASLTPKEALVLYSTNRGGFNPSVQMPKARVRRKSYANFSMTALESNSDMVFQSSETENSKIFQSYFKVLQEIRENEALRTELSKLIHSIHLFKKFKAHKRAKSKQRV